MKVTAITVKNVNGITGTIELTGKDILIGPNGSGKSTFLKAWGLAIRGKDADKRVGAKPITIRRLASGEEMGVSIMAEDGGKKFGVQRIFREDEGKGSQEIDVFPTHNEKTNTAKEARIAQELGDFPTMFDFQEYSGLSDDRRRDYIFQMFADSREGITKEEVAERIITLTPPVMGEDGTETPVELLDSYGRWREKVMENWDDSAPFIENFNNVLNFLIASKKDLQARRREAEAAAKKLVELKNEHGENVTRFNGREIQEQIDTLDAQREEIIRTIATHRERSRAVTITANRIASLKSAIQERKEITGQQMKRLSNLPELIHDARNALAEMEANVRMIGNCPVGNFDCDELLAARKEAGDTNEELNRKIQETRLEVKNMEDELNTLQSLKKSAEERAFYSQQLRDLQKDEQSAGPVVDVATLESQKSGLDINIVRLKEELQAKKEAKMAWEQAEKAALSREQLDVEIEAVKYLQSIVGPRGIQGDIVREVMGPLSETIQELMVGGGEGEQFDFRMEDENGKEVFELGFSRDDHFIQVPSGGEEILFRAAFLTALIVKAAPRNRALLFELAEVDKSRASSLLGSLSLFVDEGKLDNVLIASCHDMIVPTGWRVNSLLPGGDIDHRLVTDVDDQTFFEVGSISWPSKGEESDPCPEPSTPAVISDSPTKRRKKESSAGPSAEEKKQADLVLQGASL